MALKKLKQKTRDEVLDKASRSEHGLAKFAHLNVLVEYINKLEQRIAALEQAG
jgi:hypothetical protein